MSSAPDEHLTEVYRLLHERAGLEPESLGGKAVAHAVRRRLAARGAEAAADYLPLLHREAGEFQELVEEIVVPETWFFRDESAFSALVRHASARRGAADNMYRVLSVACSTGEEAYSLAMVLSEAGFAPSEFRVVGVDLSRRSIEAARQGVFSERSFRHLDPARAVLRERWFRREGPSWQAGEAIRAAVEFRWDNLAQREFLSGEPPMDAVFCRNVLIYFHAAARREAARHLQGLLKAGGLLCSAPAEAPIFSQAGFRRFDGDCPFAFQRPDRLAEPPALPPDEAERRQPAARAGAPVPPRAASLPRAVAAARPNAGAGLAAAPAPPLAARPALWAAARAAADGGRLEEADRLCAELLAHDTADSEAHGLRGVVQQARGMLAEAQRSFERALYLDPKHYPSLVHLMLLARQRGDTASAANYERRARQVASREAK